MKKLIFLAISLAIIISGCKKTEKNTDDEVVTKHVADSADNTDSDSIETEESEEKTDEPKHLTQYILVETDKKFGPHFRDNAKLLRNMGFRVKTFERPDGMDEMSDFKELIASRPGRNGVTEITFTSGEDRTCTIDFANESELASFIESMQAAGYSKKGHIYSHPGNVAGMGMIYAKIEGLTVTMISPFEMLGTNF